MGKALKMIPDVELCDVRHSELGRSIEFVQDEMFALEELHKSLIDSNPKAAYTIRMMLEAVDMLSLDYDLVR